VQRGFNDMNQDELRERTKKFIAELNLPISRFARSIGFERATYYKWIKGDFDFGSEKCMRINEHLQRFGF